MYSTRPECLLRRVLKLSRSVFVMNSVSKPTRSVIWEAYADLSLWASSKKSVNCCIRE